MNLSIILGFAALQLVLMFVFSIYYEQRVEESEREKTQLQKSNENLRQLITYPVLTPTLPTTPQRDYQESVAFYSVSPKGYTIVGSEGLPIDKKVKMVTLDMKVKGHWEIIGVIDNNLNQIRGSRFRVSVRRQEL